MAFDDLRDIISCIRRPPEVIVPPMPGFDAGVHEIGEDMCVVIATDPCIGVPEEWFGWLLIHYSASDVALFGARPRFCTVNLLGPPRTKKAVFKKIMEQACDAADELGIAIVTGHTGTYEGLSTLLATCTSYGTVKRDKLVTPAGARPGDYILLTKPLGLETLVNFALAHKSLARELFGSRHALNLAGQIKMQTCVEEALLLAAKGASAMHDATEGGLVAALNEMADASGVGFSVDFANLPITPELQRLVKHFNLTQVQTLSMSSTGTLLAALPPHNEDKAVDALSRLGLKARMVGSFSRSKERLLICDGREDPFPRVIDDPYARIFGD